MARAKKTVKKTTSEDSVFHMIVGVTAVTLLAGINFFFFDPIFPHSSNMTADISDFVVSPTSEKSDFEPLPADDIEIPESDPLDPMPQCDFRSSVNNVIYGQPVNFYWDCIKADRCSLDGVGQVPVSKRDGVEVVPKRSAKYELVCENSFGSRSLDIDIGVFEFSLKEINLNGN